MLPGQAAPPLRLPLGEVGFVLEPDVLGAGEQRPLLLGLLGLGRPHPVELPGRELDDVEPVGDLRFKYRRVRDAFGNTVVPYADALDLPWGARVTPGAKSVRRGHDVGVIWRSFR